MIGSKVKNLKKFQYVCWRTKMKITMLGIVGLFICFCSSGQVFGQPPGTAWADFSNMDGYVNGVVAGGFEDGDKTEYKSTFDVQGSATESTSFYYEVIRYEIGSGTDPVVLATSSSITLSSGATTTIPIHYTTTNTQDSYTIKVKVYFTGSQAGTQSDVEAFYETPDTPAPPL